MNCKIWIVNLDFGIQSKPKSKTYKEQLKKISIIFESMDKRDMIIQAYNHQDLINSCKVIGGSNWEDIRSEITAKMLEMSDARLATIRNILGYMVLSAYRISIDQKKVAKEFKVFEQSEGLNHIKIKEKIKKDMQHPKRFYHARVFMNCIEYGSVKAFSKQTGIPYKEVRETFIDYKKYIKSWYQSHI